MAFLGSKWVADWRDHLPDEAGNIVVTRTTRPEQMDRILSDLRGKYPGALISLVSDGKFDNSGYVEKYGIDSVVEYGGEPDKSTLAALGGRNVDLFVIAYNNPEGVGYYNWSRWAHGLGPRKLVGYNTFGYIKNITGLNIYSDFTAYPVRRYLGWTLPYISNFLLLIASCAAIALFGKWRIGSSKGGGKKVHMLVKSQLHQDPRVMRAAQRLAEEGYDVRITCPLWTLDRERLKIDWGPGITVEALPYQMSFNIYPYLMNWAMLWRAMKSGAGIIHCHDLNTCLIGLAASVYNGAYCVCDFHEWFSENATYDEQARQYRAHDLHVWVAYWAAEIMVTRFASHLVTVNDSIVDGIRQKCGTSREMTVIRNIPFPRQVKAANGAPAGVDGLREITGAGPDDIIVMYQGGAGPSRYLEPIIEALKFTEGALLVIRGPGIQSYRGAYMALAGKHGVEGRVFCLDPVPSAMVVEAARGADVGIWSTMDICDSFRLSLPNKLFEYLFAGLPVLAADFPEARKLVRGHDVGLLFNPHNPESIAGAINSFRSDAAARDRMKANIPLAIQDMNAEDEWDKLVYAYESVLNNGGYASSAHSG